MKLGYMRINLRAIPGKQETKSNNVIDTWAPLQWSLCQILSTKAHDGLYHVHPDKDQRQQNADPFLPILGVERV